MGNRYPVNFCIGGDVPHDVAEAMAEQLMEHRFWPADFAGDQTEPMTIADLEAQLELTRQFVYVRDDEASWNDVEEFEGWLRAHDIPFIRESEPYFSDGGTTRWSIGDFDCTKDTVEEGEPFVRLSDLTVVQDLLDAGDVFAAQGQLAKLAPKFPPLPPFRIVP